MKKIISSVLFLSLFSLTSTATLWQEISSETNIAPEWKQLFSGVVELTSSLYEKGFDRNEIVSEIIYSPTMTENFSVVNLTSPELVMDALKDCVYVKEGSSNDHLDDNTQHEFAVLTTEFIRLAQARAMYRLSGPYVNKLFPNTSTDCAFAIRKKERTLVLQGQKLTR